MRDTNIARREREMQRDPYLRRFPVRGWNVFITVCEEPKLFRRLPEFNGWTKARHEQAARDYATQALAYAVLWTGSVKLAIAAHGDGNGVLISGVYRDHFPEHWKTALRLFAHTETDYWSRSSAHWRAAGKQLHTWRTMRDDLRKGQTP